MDALFQVEGLTALTTPISGNRGNKLALPIGFDFTRYASRWAIDGPEVSEAQQPEILQYINGQAQGWAVWKGTTGKSDPYTRVLGKYKFVLMFRPKALQDAVMQAYAAESRARVNLELLGKTNNANVEGDPGILSGDDLRRVHKLSGENEEILPPTLVGQKPSDAANLKLNT